MELLGNFKREVTIDSIEFFKKVVQAKLANNSIDMSWYVDTFLKSEKDKNLVAAHSGLSVKSINNKRKTARREVVLEEALLNYESLLSTINSLCDSEIDIDLAITFNGVTVKLSLSESLIVINALAMRRNQIRGGFWSWFGKKIEYPLLKTMCIMFSVPESNYSRGNRKNLREIDFCLIDGHGNLQRCEVKLMGKGNPEGADSLYARGANVFVASKLSETNIKQLDSANIEWVELDRVFGFLKFGEVLENFGIQHRQLPSSNKKLVTEIGKAINKLTYEDFENMN